MTGAADAAVFPWLQATTTVENYVDPRYYGRLLKPYAFAGRSDLELFDAFARSRGAVESALELGSGPGRVTDVFVAAHPSAPLTLVDLSPRMLNYTREKFAGRTAMKFANVDALQFLRETDARYDFAFTLWSFSHSVHQWVHRMGIETATQIVFDILRKFLVENLTPGGAFFLMHFDSMSDEQRILMPQWGRVYEAFADNGTQSPSKRIVERALRRLDDECVIRLSSAHLRGDPIIYESEDQVLEIMLNFHLESYFNDRPERDDVLRDIRQRIVPFRQAGGSYAIAPGAYIFTLERI